MTAQRISSVVRSPPATTEVSYLEKLTLASTRERVQRDTSTTTPQQTTPQGTYILYSTTTRPALTESTWMKKKTPIYLNPVQIILATLGFAPCLAFLWIASSLRFDTCPTARACASRTVVKCFYFLGADARWDVAASHPYTELTIDAQPHIYLSVVDDALLMNLIIETSIIFRKKRCSGVCVCCVVRD